MLSLHSFPRAILHIDGDAFFASCEQAVHPDYRGKPVVTGKERGIVAAASYEAKARGVSRGTPLWDVKRLCPEAIIVPSDYETYSLFSKRMFAIMRRWTPLVEEYSIDEAFVDITGLQRPFHQSYEMIALDMKRMIERELGLPVSIGLSLTKVLAKIGSKWNKPSGFTPIPGREIETFLKKTPIENVWGIGPKTAAYCRLFTIKTALDFIRKDELFIKQKFTKPHQEIWRELRGEPVHDVTIEEKTDYQTISKWKTWSLPSSNQTIAFGELIKNLENACEKARRHHLFAKRVLIFLRTQSFHDRGIELMLDRPSAFPPEIAPLVRQGFQKIWQPESYRATGIILADLGTDRSMQVSLFEPPMVLEKWRRVYRALDAVNEKCGRHTIHLATTAEPRSITQKRGGIPERALHRLRDENRYQHLAIPLLLSRKKL